MLLKCIKKLGKQVSASDRADLEDSYNQHIESGLSEHAASAAALTDYHKVLFDATNAMRKAARAKPLPYQRYERPVREEIPPAKVEPSVQPEPSGGTKWNQGDVVTFNGLEGTIKDSYTDKYGESVVVDTANGEKVWPADKIKTTPPASVESSASGEVGGQMTVEEFESSGYELPSGLQNRGVTTIKARGSNKFDVTLKDGKVLSDVLINKSLGGKKVDNKALLTPSETTQIAYNGKMQDFDGEFKDAALKVAVNLSSTDKGYIKTPDGKVYEISSDKKRAKLLPDRITTTAPETRKTQETAAKISPTKKVEPKQPKLAEKEKTTPAATDATTEPRDIPDGTTVTKKVNRKTYTGVVETVDGKQRVGKVSDGKNNLPGTNKLDESWKPESLLHKGELTEPMKAILKENVADIIDDAKFRTDGRVITAENLEGYGVLEQAVTKALGENMSLGRPLTPKETQDVIKAIQELAPNSKVGERLVRMLKSASRGGRYIGVGIPESERHELFHALQLQLAAGKDAKTLPMAEVIQRIMRPETVAEIVALPVYKKSNIDKLYPGTSDALRANEFVTAVLTGQFEYLGLDPQTDTAEMIQAIRLWGADQHAQYGDKIDWSIYEKINVTTEFFIAELQESQADNKAQDGRAEDIGEQPAQERAGQADNAVDTDEGVKKPAYAKKHLGTDEVEYEPESMSTTSARAEVYARTNDIYDILEDVRHSTGNLPAKMTALYQEQERLSAYAQHLRRQGLETEYQAIIAELKSLTEAIISAQIQTGRAVNMAKILNPLSPEDALAVTARLKKRFTGNENVELSKEYNDQTRKLAEELEKINGELEAAKRKLAEAELTEAQNSDDEKHAAKSNTQSKLLKEYRQKKPEIVAKLKELFPEAPVTFRMAAQPDPLDPEKQELLTQWTTGQILEGLPYTETIDTLKKFGLTADEAQQIHSDAVDVIRPAVAPRTAEVKERAKIRAEHYREAKKFNKNPQSLSVIAQDAQNDDRYNDLIKAIDYLTNTETGQQGRSLSGLINLIREGNNLSMADAEQLAHRAKQAVNTIRAERKERRDEARGISKEQRQIINDRTVLKRTASLKMNKHLEGLQRTEWLNHRINNIQRGLFVYNWATQAFNAVAVATVSTPANLMLDSMGAFMRNALGLNVGENQDVRAKDLLLPIYYMIGRNKKLANESLAKFAEQYFRVHTGVLGDIQVEARPQSDNAPALTKPIHKLIDKIDKFMGEKMAVWSGAKGLEIHFRNAMVAARLDQVVRAKSKGAETLETALENGTFLNYVTENDAARTADNALEHTYASEISDPIGKALKRAYDQVDNFLPLPLNPVTYARFMWTVTQGLVVNPLTFGAYGDTKITGGRGLNNRSIAKGVLAWGSLFPIMALQGAFGGDDDRWDTLYLDDSGIPFSVKRFFPLSAYFFISHHLRKVLYEGAPPPSKEELAEGLMSLEIDYFNYGASVDFWKQISGLGSTTSMDDMKRSTARLLGNYLSGIFRVALPVKQIVSQLNDSERTLKQDSDDASDQFVTEMSRSLPFIHKLSDAQPKIDPVTERPILQPWPLGRMFGLGFIHPALLRNEDSPATEWANQYFGYKGTNNVLSAADKNANFIKRRLKEAVRKGTIDLLTADEKAQKFLAGIIEPEAVGRLRDDLKLSELQAVIKQGFGLKQNGDNKKIIDKFSTVWDRSTDKEKEDLRYILERKDSLTPEFMRQFKLYSKPGVIADLMKNPNDVRHWNTDSWARVIESGQLSQKDVDEAAQKLYEKAGNALRSKSLTEAEIQNIKVAIPDFTEEKAKEAASEAAAGKREPTMADLVRKGQMTEADAKKALAEQLKNGEITKRQYTGRLKALSITKVEEDAKDLDASKPEDFAKVKSFLGNVSDADRKKVYDVMTKKIANKTRGDYSVKAKNDQAELRKIVNEWWSGKPAPPDTDRPKIPSIKPVRKTIAPKKPAYQSPY